MHDIDDLIALAVQHWPLTPFGHRVPDLERLRNIFAWSMTTPGVAAWVIWDGAHVVGYLGLALKEHFFTGELLADEGWWFVAPDARGRAGLALLKRGEAWAAEHDAAMRISFHDPTLRPLLERLGYNITEYVAEKKVR